MLALLFKLSLCFACSDERAAAWVGHNLDDLIRAWGPPTSSATLSDGAKIVEWSLERRTGGGQQYDDGSGGKWTAQPVNLHCRVRVEANPKNVVTSAKVDGNLGGCNTLFRDKHAPGDKG